jgi:TRAP-type C4-dicarboxylate transport system substrate-binding protein
VVESPVFVLTVKAFGANPTPMAFPEIYTALQQGTIDGVETNYYGFPLGKFQEVAKHLAITDHIYTAAAIVMNEKKFKALSPAYQAALLEAAEAGGKVMREAADKANQDAIAELTKAGVVATRPPREAFEARVKPVYEYFELRVGKDLIDKIKAAQK